MSGIKDTSPNGNVIVPVTHPFSAQNVVYNLESAKLPDQAISTPGAGLPLGARDTWTINLLVKADVAPQPFTVIGGFGALTNNSDSGFGRYFAVFQDGIRLWSSNCDVVTNSPFEVNRWQMLTASYDGKTLSVYKDGEPIAKKDVELSTDSEANVNVGPPDPWNHKCVFHGSVQAFTIRRDAMTDAEIKTLFDQTKP